MLVVNMRVRMPSVSLARMAAVAITLMNWDGDHSASVSWKGLNCQNVSREIAAVCKRATFLTFKNLTSSRCAVLSNYGSRDPTTGLCLLPKD